MLQGEMLDAIRHVLKSHPKGLKAKYIAKKLGTDRKSINSFLYSNKRHFFVDKDYKWYLNGPEDHYLPDRPIEISDVINDDQVDEVEYETSETTILHAPPELDEEYDKEIDVPPEDFNSYTEWTQDQYE